MRRLQARIVKTAYTTINAALRTAAFLRWPLSKPATANRICIFRIGHIGDIACALPAISSIRRAYPDAHLTLLTSPGQRGIPGAADVLADAKWIDELRIYHTDDIDTLAKQWSLVRSLRARRFDVWIDLPNNLSTISRQCRDMLFASLVAPKWARGWRIDTLKWAARAQSEYLHFPNEVDRLIRIVRESGVDVAEAAFPIARTPDTRARIDVLMRTLSLTPDRLIALAPEAKRSTNLWPAERFAEAGRELARHGYTIVLIAGKSESLACAQIAAQIGTSAHSVAGTLSVAESCELLRRCRLLICLDSGTQHLAAAIGTPCLSLFSFWQMRGKWHPHGPRNVVLQKWVPCHTCLLDECPNCNRCMKAIEVAEVVRQAATMLEIDAARASIQRSTRSPAIAEAAAA